MKTQAVGDAALSLFEMDGILNSKMVFFLLSVFALYHPLHADELSVSQPKSPGSATAMSLACTLIPGALAMPFVTRDVPESNWNEIAGGSLITSGVLFGPGTGYLYSHDRKAFHKGVLMRAIGGGMLLAGVAKKESLYDNDTFAEILIVSGGTVVLISMIRDIARVGGSARRYNKEHGFVTGLYPTIQFGPNDVRLGLSLRL